MIFSNVTLLDESPVSSIQGTIQTIDLGAVLLLIAKEMTTSNNAHVYFLMFDQFDLFM